MVECMSLSSNGIEAKPSHQGHEEQVLNWVISFQETTSFGYVVKYSKNNVYVASFWSVYSKLLYPNATLEIWG